MSKYKPTTDPITRSEALAILDRQRFDAAVRAEDLVPLGKLHDGKVVTSSAAPVTAPLVFDQEAVRTLAKTASDRLANEGKDFRLEAKAVAKLKPPMTRRHVAQHLGKRLTGVVIRSGALEPVGKLTDTQTAAHTYDPADVAALLNGLADERYAEAKLLKASSKVRVPA